MTLQEQVKKIRDGVRESMPKATMQVFTESISRIKADKLKETALQVGDKIQDYPLTDIEGNKVELSKFIHSDYLILNFYRGGWCPYCNLELREYERLQNNFKEQGINIIAISPETPESAYQTIDKNTLSYPVLTDTDAQFMKKIGIVFQLDIDSKREFVNFGIDFTNINGNENFELPVPAVYVINRDMEVVFVHFEEDYMTRLEPTELLEKLKNKKMIAQSKKTLKQAIENVIQAGTTFEIEQLEQVYHENLKVIMVDQNGLNGILDKQSVKNMFQAKRDNGDSPLNDWAEFNHIQANGDLGHVIVTRKVNLTGVEQRFVFNIDLVRNGEGWLVTREVVVAQSEG
ncbi:peroxiredoxin-like family protein [Echinicola jeungdonensis]|uniref:thioredoxin-dependent peroxiredoxin n=1 Tax=Echinicola jeungdonensis TaxID=709343 RepID=A0ABV5J2V8_9BACT|nr:peroxiredoxin-like family protein [Echinicola jeungdonensis]MDN3667988.1 peroxiredoxin-like family protein [Echinicola jeungdonensis]